MFTSCISQCSYFLSPADDLDVLFWFFLIQVASTLLPALYMLVFCVSASGGMMHFLLISSNSFDV